MKEQTTTIQFKYAVNIGEALGSRAVRLQAIKQLTAGRKFGQVIRFVNVLVKEATVSLSKIEQMQLLDNLACILVDEITDPFNQSWNPEKRRSTISNAFVVRLLKKAQAIEAEFGNPKYTAIAALREGLIKFLSIRDAKRHEEVVMVKGLRVLAMTEVLGCLTSVDITNLHIPNFLMMLAAFQSILDQTHLGNCGAAAAQLEESGADQITVANILLDQDSMCDARCQAEEQQEEQQGD